MQITIVIPEANYVERLATCLYGLVNQSYYNHKIIVVTSDIGDKSDKNSIAHYMHTHRDFIESNDIQIMDISLSRKVTSEFLIKSMQAQGKAYQWGGGADTAFKTNFGIDLATTEWVMPNFDDDFYPSENWDLNLFKIIDPKLKAVYIPTHVQPYSFKFLKESYKMDLSDNDIDMEWVWRKSREIACGRLIIPIHREPISIYESEWDEFVQKFSKKETLMEECGKRGVLHYLPMLYKKKDVIEIGGYSLKGTGYDIEIDDRLRNVGNYIKVSTCDSFILHKGFIERGL